MTITIDLDDALAQEFAIHGGWTATVTDDNGKIVPNPQPFSDVCQAQIETLLRQGISANRIIGAIDQATSQVLAQMNALVITINSVAKPVPIPPQT